MLKVYRAMKVRDGVSVPEAEALLARQMDGTLESRAAAALKRSREKLQKTYGADAAPAAPIVTASARP
jgi:hypothetical protein